MARSIEGRGGRPTPDQELLLDTVFGAAGEAVDAWQRWKARNALDEVDWGTQRLLPLVYARLSELSVDDPDIGRLKGLYRHTWYRNQVRFRSAAEAVAALHEAGLEVMLMKGGALALLHYGDAGLRPMDDVDLLVETSEAAAALEVLATRGWSPVTNASRQSFLMVRHAEELTRTDGAPLDLHWNALWQPGRDDELWAAAVDTAISGEPVKAPCPTDELLLACVHGSAWNAVPPVRWAADALAVLAAGDDAVDWTRLARLARARRVTLQVGWSLEYLRRRFGAAVPAAVVKDLAATPARLHERIGHRASLASPGPMRTLAVVWDRYRRLRDVDTALPRPASFVGYAVETWGLEGAPELAAHAARRAAARTLARVTRRPA